MEDPLLFWLQWPPTRRFTMTGASSPETSYCYRVRATNVLGGSPYSDPVACADTFSENSSAIDFGGSGSYVTFGQAPDLGLSHFTIECWFRREGSGVTTTTGTGGITDAIPLITKGRGESENSNVDMNYFLGIRQSDGVLVADFEEGAAGSNPGLNHPVIGVTPINNNIWYHAAVTYNGSCWQLYLDGNPETDGTNCPGQPPRSDSIQHAGIASAMTSNGTAAGFFDGMIDEAPYLELCPNGNGDKSHHQFGA